ncbi:MAG: molybdopterin-synthase adenylyltransferase MoeB [Sphingomonadales bacterium]|jgi:adenylyltransferase/sulfurtransferase
MSLTDSELDRYARHIVLPDVGGRGQMALHRARVAVVGAGGLGAPLLLYLAAAGVGRLTIIDDDVVALSNLQRQVLYATADLGALKAEAAAAHLAALNPHVELVPVALRLDAENADALLAGHDVIADGCDNFATRLVVARTAVALQVPLVSGAVGQFDGQWGSFAGHLPDQPCYQCFVGHDPETPGRNCAEAGVLGALTGLVGSQMALEVLRLLTGFGSPQTGRLHMFDGLAGRSRSLALAKDAACPICAAA